MRTPLLGTTAVVIGATLALSACSTTATAPTSAPPSPTATAPITTMYGQAIPPNAPTQKMVSYGVEIPPGVSIASHQHPGQQIARITDGELTYTVLKGTVTVFDGTVPTGAVPSHEVTAPATLTLTAGTTIAEPENMVHKAQNNGSVPVKIQATVLVPKDDPLSIPVPEPSATS